MYVRQGITDRRSTSITNIVLFKVQVLQRIDLAVNEAQKTVITHYQSSTIGAVNRRRFIKECGVRKEGTDIANMVSIEP